MIQIGGPSPRYGKKSLLEELERLKEELSVEIEDLANWKAQWHRVYDEKVQLQEEVAYLQKELERCELLIQALEES